jgi:hypothetical protein
MSHNVLVPVMEGVAVKVLGRTILVLFIADNLQCAMENYRNDIVAVFSSIEKCTTKKKISCHIKLARRTF